MYSRKAKKKHTLTLPKPVKVQFEFELGKDWIEINDYVNVRKG